MFLEWMSDPTVLALTESEPLTLEEEYEMQITWSLDADKRTFIIVNRHSMPTEVDVTATNDDNFVCKPFLIKKFLKDDETPCKHSSTLYLHPDPTQNLSSKVVVECDCEKIANIALNSIDSCAGDVNLFFPESLQEDSDADSDDENDNITSKTAENAVEKITKPKLMTAEIDVMIAETTQRRQGLGHAAIQMMMNYGINYLNIERFIAKILDDNIPSIKLFEKLNYTTKCIVECFNEIHLEYIVSKE